MEIIHSCTDITFPGKYVLASNIEGVHVQDYCIGIFASDVVLEGNGYSITGDGWGTGILLSYAKNVTIEDVNVSNYWAGIYLDYSNNNTINNVTASNNWAGIYLWDSNNNVIANSTISENDAGIHLGYSSNNTIRDSQLQNNGLFVFDSYDNTVENTTVNGKPLVYLENVQNQEINNAGQVILVRCSNITVKDLDLSNATVGTELWESELIKIENLTASSNWAGILLRLSNNNTINNVTASNNWAGILLDLSNNNTITDIMASNNEGGILLTYSNNNSIAKSTFSNSKYYGVVLDNSSNNTIASSIISDNKVSGIYIDYSSNNSITNSTLSNNQDGIRLYSSNNNSIVNSTISNNDAGILLTNSSNNLIYNNYFSNMNNVTIYDSQPNTWNITKTEGKNIVDGNYLGGNYWSSPDGNGFSDKCGDADKDGICDQPFAIDENNTDWLPLAKVVLQQFSVSGFVSYVGNQQGEIYLCALKDFNSQPVICSKTSDSSYEIEISQGRYYIAAFMDVNGNETPDSAEPVGFAIEKKYPDEADLIEVNQDIYNVSITLYDVDLNISKVIVTPENPVEGQEITINATVVNLGGSFAENFKVSLYVNGTEVENRTISLYFNETKHVEFHGSPQAGTYEIRIVVDPENAVNESDEANNEYSVKISVSPPGEVWQTYDKNGDGRIDTSELISAIKDWLEDRMGTVDLVKIIRKWLES